MRRAMGLLLFVVLACTPVWAGNAGVPARGIWISDLTRFGPSDAIARAMRPKTWIAVDYEVDEGKGVMLYAASGFDAPNLTLKLGVDGWHKIRLGIFYSGTSGLGKGKLIMVKLSDDPGFCRVTAESYRKGKDGDYPEKDVGQFDITEAFWRCADLTGQDLIIAAPKKGRVGAGEANLAYIRLIPMSEADIAEWKVEQPTPKTKRLMASCDGGSLRTYGISTREEFTTEFQHFRDSDFEIVTYGMARAASALYPSKKVEMISPYGAHGRGEWAHKCLENGLDSLEEAIKAAHAVGLKFFPRNRIVGPNLPVWHTRLENGGKLMADHPEWMCTYADGEPTRHLSLAYQGVRDHHVRMMREWVEDYRADGASLVFSRGFPFVYHEKPVREAFEKEYGEPFPKEPPPSDLRIQRVRASFVTQFLREIRTMLDEVGKAQGRSIPNCYLIPVHNSPRNTPREAYATLLGETMFSGLDVAAWIREGLVDYLNIHLHMSGQHDGTEPMHKIREVTDLAKGTKTKVYVDIYPRRMPPRQFRKIAMSYYKAGADGLSFWDTPGRMSRISEWAFVKRLGHHDDLPRWEQEGKGDDYYNVVPLRRLDGFLMGREYSRPTDG